MLEGPTVLATSVSIIVPVLNMAGTIPRTLESIHRQSHKDIEILVVDGGSRDGTVEKVRQAQGPIAEIVSEADNGLYDAINKGLKLAKGDIVAVLNGDDFYAHEKVVANYVGAFQRSEVSILFSDLEFFLPGSPDQTIRRYSSSRFEPGMLASGWMPPHPTLFSRRSVYETVGCYDTSYRIAADFEFLVRALVSHGMEFSRLDDVTVRMQYGGLSTAGVRATLALNAEIIRACRSNGVQTNWLRIATKIPQKLLEFHPLFTTPKPVGRRIR